MGREWEDDGAGQGRQGARERSKGLQGGVRDDGVAEPGGVKGGLHGATAAALSCARHEAPPSPQQAAGRGAQAPAAGRRGGGGV